MTEEDIQSRPHTFTYKSMSLYITVRERERRGGGVKEERQGDREGQRDRETERKE